MVKSRPYMATLGKKLRALFIAVIFFAGSFSSTSAQAALPKCGLINISPETLTASTATLSVQFDPSAGLTDDTTFQFVYSGTGDMTEFFSRSGGAIDWNTNFQISEVMAGPQSIYLQASGLSGGQRFCETNIIYDQAAQVARVGQPGQGVPPTAFNVCTQTGGYRSSCDQCLESGGIWSGVGCIPYTSSGKTVRALMTIGLSITGTVVVLMTLYAGFMFSTSQGDPKRVDEAKAAVTSAIAGAFFVIFSVTLLRFIGVTLLKIPGFG